MVSRFKKAQAGSKLKRFYYNTVEPYLQSINYRNGSRPSYDARNIEKFDDAYKAAKSNGNKTFIWNGNKYNTDYKSDKPTIAQQKQEELDTYGITNEHTRDRNIVEDRLLNNLTPYLYDDAISRVFNAVILNKKDPVRAVQDESANKPGYQHRTETRDRLDYFNLLLGKPQQFNTFGVSKYKPNNAEHDYYFKLNNRTPRLTHSINEPSSQERAKETSVSYVHPKADRDLGDYTVGRTPEYRSYYDKWDINPWGSGDDKSLLGTPLNIYDRVYGIERGGKVKRFKK